MTQNTGKLLGVSMSWLPFYIFIYVLFLPSTLAPAFARGVVLTLSISYVFPFSYLGIALH